jgi:hypothetical protein
VSSVGGVGCQGRGEQRQGLCAGYNGCGEGGEGVVSQGAHRTYQRGGAKGVCLPVGGGGGCGVGLDCGAVGGAGSRA